MKSDLGLSQSHKAALLRRRSVRLTFFATFERCDYKKPKNNATLIFGYVLVNMLAYDLKLFQDFRK